MKMRPLAALMAVSLLATGLASPTVHASSAEHVQASHAWIRVLPGNLPAGAYVDLSNSSDEPTALTGASSTAYGMVMLHQSSNQGGISRMVMVHNIDLPAHGVARLEPAGYHLMLMHARAPVKPGEKVTLQLTFADGSTLPVAFIVRPANAVDDGSAHAGH